MYKYITDPIHLKKYNINTNKGQKILNNYIKYYQKGGDPCNEFRHHQTCRSKKHLNCDYDKDREPGKKCYTRKEGTSIRDSESYGRDMGDQELDPCNKFVRHQTCRSTKNFNCDYDKDREPGKKCYTISRKEGTSIRDSVSYGRDMGDQEVDPCDHFEEMNWLWGSKCKNCSLPKNIHKPKQPANTSVRPKQPANTSVRPKQPANTSLRPKQPASFAEKRKLAAEAAAKRQLEAAGSKGPLSQTTLLVSSETPVLKTSSILTNSSVKVYKLLYENSSVGGTELVHLLAKPESSKNGWRPSSFKRRMTSQEIEEFQGLDMDEETQLKYCEELFQTSESDTRRRSEILKLYEPFKKLKKKDLLDKYICIQQGGVGGCSFASILTLISVTNNQKLLKDAGFKTGEIGDVFTDDVDQNSFENLYSTVLGLDDFGYERWSVVLKEFVHNERLMRFLEKSYLRYVPLLEEGMTNPEIPGGCIKNRNPILYSHWRQTIIEYLLSRGHPIAVPFLFHFITVIGYNEDDILFLNTYGRTFRNTGLHSLKEDGRLNKKMFYNTITGFIWSPFLKFNFK